MTKIVQSDGFKKLANMSKDVLANIVSKIISDSFNDQKKKREAMKVHAKIHKVTTTNKTFEEYKKDIK